MEKIDVLLATYNGEKYIQEQINSILFNDYTNINLIISDDKSTDNTVNILKEYEKKDKRIKVYIQEKNLGYVKNFEFLLKQITCKYFMLSDQDDVWNKDKISLSYNKLISDNLDLVYTDLMAVDVNLNCIYPSFSRYLKVYKKAKKYNNYISEYLYNCVTGCTLLAKSKYINEILPIPNTSKYMIHDHYIALNYALKGKIGYLDIPTIKYRQHSNNQIGTKKETSNLNSFYNVRKLFLNVKIQTFNIYVNNVSLFDEKLKKQNVVALEYFKHLSNVKYINLSKLNIFHELYKHESIIYYISFFVIFNLPIIGKVIYNIRKKLKGENINE